MCTPTAHDGSKDILTSLTCCLPSCQTYWLLFYLHFHVSWLVCDLLVCTKMAFSLATSCMVKCICLDCACCAWFLCKLLIFSFVVRTVTIIQTCRLFNQLFIIFMSLCSAYKVDLARHWVHFFHDPQKIFASVPILGVNKIDEQSMDQNDWTRLSLTHMPQPC